MAIIRTPDQRLRVFVSSAMNELAAERAAARRAIENLRMSPILFELGARPHPPRELYAAYLEQSHIFVAIYWERYGWMGPGMSISGLEDEYDLAENLPKLIYVKRGASDREQPLTDLLERIKRDARVSYKSFHDPAELQQLIENDLALLLTEHFHGGDRRSGEDAAAGRPISNLPA